MFNGSQKTSFLINELRHYSFRLARFARYFDFYMMNFCMRPGEDLIPSAL